VLHEFRDPALLDLALTHGSFGGTSNERLEFLGDSVLDLIVAEELYKGQTQLSEGELTALKAELVSRKSLADIARSMNLEAQARTGQGLSGRTLPTSVLANLYEALLGAIYLDAGLEAARAFVLHTMGTALARVQRGHAISNPKQELQILLQKAGRPLPRYVLLESRGAAHEKVFCVCAEVEGVQHTAAWGRSLREAETWAAHEALLALRSKDAQ
jgi:ribonuclease-3